MSTPSSSSLSDFRSREEQLRRLDAELNAKKNEVVRRAEELVKQQTERLAKMEEQHQTPSAASASYGIGHHTFDSNENGFLDETTGYRGRVENMGIGSKSRPASGVPSASSFTPSSLSSNTTASASRSYSRPMSAATQEGRRRQSAIPTPGANTTAMATTPAMARAGSAARITPSSLASASSSQAHYTSSGPSRPRSSIAPITTAPSSYSRLTADLHDVDAHDDGEYVDDISGGANADAQGDDLLTSENTGLDGMNLPSSSMGSAATIRFQKARIDALTTSVQSLTTALADREKELGDLKLLVKNGNDSREKLLRSKETLEKSAATSAKTIQDLETKLAQSEGELSGLRREVGSIEKRRKEFDAESKSKDAKLNRCLAEMERLKEQLAKVKSGGATGGPALEELNREVTSLRLGNKKLLQQRQDLLAGFKKQQKLIEILKKQKLHMELAKMLNFTEEEFAKSLEMGEI